MTFLVLLLLAATQRADLVIPNPTLTPGVIAQIDAHGVVCAVGATGCRPRTLEEICAMKWGADERHVSDTMKQAVFAGYMIPWAEHAEYETDHTVSRENGGADAVLNLYPEPWYLNVGGLEEGAHEKDKAENAAHKAMCVGQPGYKPGTPTISLLLVQRVLASDWRPLYLRFVGPFPTYVGSPAGRPR